eukprot:GILI01007415.1.p1 GENE.GILI01007415.1~~GILI01007415.1.p1  ORF type:complete len:137 (-),score=35.46 GILI01007415.1:43-393(-)
MTIETDVSNIMDPSQLSDYPENGVYIHGLFMEGARWDAEKNLLRDSHLKELFPPLPVVIVRAIRIEDKCTTDIYECPCYVTSMRGPTFVFTATLKTKDPAHKWILGGVALLMSLDE